MLRRDLLAGAASVALMGMGPAQRRLLLSGGNTGPSLTLSLFGPSLDGRLAFARASSGTYFDASGVLQTAAANVPRFDHDPVTFAPLGLLIEEQRTNVVAQSGMSSLWLVTGGTTTLNAGTAPDGTLTAPLFTQDTSTGGHYIQQIPAVAANATYASSFFIKLAGAQRYAAIQVFDSTAPANNIVVGFDLVGLAVGGVTNAGTGAGAAGTITNVGNGWFRITVTGTPSTAANIGVIVRLRLATSFTTFAYTGDGVSGFYAWGAQLEAATLGGAAQSSYIPTTTTAATRAPDTLSMPVGPWFNPAAFTLAAKYMLAQGTNPSSLQRNVLGLYDATSANQAVLRAQEASGSTAIFVTEVAGGAATNSASVLTTAANTVEKMIASWVPGAQSGCGNGGSVLTTAAAGIPSVTTLAIGNDYSSAFLNLNGWVQQAVIWPRALAPTEQQQWTT